MKMFETLGALDATVLILFLVALVAISVIFNKKVKTAGDVTGSNKNFSIPLIVGATIATCMGAYSGMGALGPYLANGFAGLTVSWAWNVGWIALCIMAKPLRASGANTLPEFIAIKYSPSTQKVSSVVALVYTMAQIAGQFIACGTVFALLGLGTMKQGIIIMGLIIVALTMFGGLKGVAITNTIQSVFIVAICVFIIPVLVLAKAGGVGNMIDYWQAVDSTKLNFFSGMTPSMLIAAVVSQMLCSGAEPSYAAKFLSAKDVKTGVKGSVISMITCTLIPLPICLAVMSAPLVMPSLTDGTHFFPVMINAYMPPVIKGLALFAFLSLFLTTGNSFLQLASVLITNDFIKPAMPDADDKKVLRINTLLIVVLGVFSLLVALWGDSIYQVMILGSGCYGAAIFCPLALGCFTKRKYNPRNINIAMITGCAVTILWDQLLSDATGIAGVIMGAVCCLIICLIGSKSGQKKNVISLEEKKEQAVALD